jgi:hypothetical protein
MGYSDFKERLNNIPKIKDGRFIKISKEELDKLFENKIII